MRRLLALGVMLFLVALVQATYAQPEVTVSVPEGTFIVRVLTLESRLPLVTYKSIEFKAEVTNNTPKIWSKVQFELVLYDSNGNMISAPAGLPPFTFEVEAFAPGQTRTVWELTRWMIPATASILRFDVTFKRGSYPATYTFVLTKPKESPVLAFEDDAARFSFSLPESNRQIRFILFNKTSAPIRLDWNQVSYIDTSGKSHRVMHEGVRYIDRNSPQPPTTIPPGARIDDIIFPTDYVAWSGSDWEEIPLFPEAPEAHLFQGKTFGIFMPLEVAGKLRNYTFTFRIREVRS